jgi:hypothetical protein
MTDGQQCKAQSLSIAFLDRCRAQTHCAHSNVRWPKLWSFTVLAKALELHCATLLRLQTQNFAKEHLLLLIMTSPLFQAPTHPPDHWCTTHSPTHSPTRPRAHSLPRLPAHSLNRTLALPTTDAPLTHPLTRPNSLTQATTQKASSPRSWATRPGVLWRVWARV